MDATRPISGNLLHDSAGTMIDHFDVVGISHVSTIPAPWTPLPAQWYDPRYSYQYFHKRFPQYVSHFWHTLFYFGSQMTSESLAPFLLAL